MAGTYVPPSGDATDLRLKDAYTPPAGDSVTLNFNNGIPADAGTTIAIVITKAAPTLSVTLARTSIDRTLLIEITKTKPVMQEILDWAGIPPRFIQSLDLLKAKPALSSTVQYDNRVLRYDVYLQALSPFEKGSSNIREDVDSVYEVATPIIPSSSQVWESGTVFNGGQIKSPFEHMLTSDRPATVQVWEDSTKTSEYIEDLYEVATPTNTLQYLPWEDTTKLSDFAVDAFKLVLDKLVRENKTPWGIANKITFCKSYTHSLATSSSKPTAIPWQEAKKALPGTSTIIIIPPEPPVVEYIGKKNLDFICKAVTIDGTQVEINFTNTPCNQGGTIIIPNLAVYIMANTFLMTNIASGNSVAVISMNITIDMSSWCWGMSANIPASEFHKISPDSAPTEVQVTINGTAWRFIVEDYTNNEQFGSMSYTIKGRSLTAYLDLPFAPVRAFTNIAPASAITLASDEVDRPGLVTGYTVDWSLVPNASTEWVIDTGVFSYQNLTPIKAIQSLAEAAKGYVSSHKSLKQVQVRSRYPQGESWNWGSYTPDIIIPRGVVTDMGMSWTSTIQSNSVYVAGETNGVVAYVTKDGTAGDIMADMFVNKYVSSSAVAREAGKALLSQGGKAAEVDISTPLLSEMGVVPLGTLIYLDNSGSSFTSWEGLVTGVSISASWSDNEGLTIAQKLSIERHF